MRKAARNMRARRFGDVRYLLGARCVCGVCRSCGAQWLAVARRLADARRLCDTRRLCDVRRLRDVRGQSTVEAAFMLPIAFILVLMLVQPGILLYDRMVMQGAAAEGCRLLATNCGEGSNVSERQCEAYIKRSLAAVPEQDCFHVHGQDCTWNIELSGGESAQNVEVSISTEVKPLPLFDAGAVLLGLVNERGNLVVKVEETCEIQPSWVASSPAGSDPASWVGAWIDD